MPFKFRIPTLVISVFFLTHFFNSIQLQAQSFTQEAEGFNIFVSGDLVFGGGDVEGAVAVGNNLTLQNNIGQFAIHEAGSYKIGGASVSTALLVGNQVFLNAGGLRLLSGGNISIGSNTGTQALSLENGNPSNTRIVSASGSYSSTPNISLDHIQNEAIYQSSPINFGSAFSNFEGRSTRVAALNANLNITNANGNPIDPDNIPTNSQVYINSLSDGENILNLTGINLNKITSITFREKPSASKYVIINIDSPGSLNWINFGFAGVGSTEAQYILLNFSNSSVVNINNGRTVYATIFAPFADITKNNSNNIDGQLIGKSFTMTQGGEVHRMYFIPDDPSSTIFPVEWLDLGVKEDRGRALVEWSTISELGSSHFVIERSGDLVLFESLGRVEATGNSDQIQKYRFLDHQLEAMASQKVYYRLRQVDLDGEFSFSSIMELKLNAIPNIEIIYGPNPVQDMLEVSWSGTDEVFQVSIKNLLGQALIKKSPQGSSQVMNLDLSRLESGMYFLQLDSNSGLISRSIQLK
ncbi:MAG: collagen-binding domain-containing protein [Bacteroidota bacterium]